jgi:transcriptional regulator with XRE-family HTH domain
MWMAFKDRLAQARRAKGLTQKAIGDHFGISSQAVSGWERGTDRPDVDRVGSLAALLDTTTDWLLESDEDHADAHGRELRVVGYVSAGGETTFYPAGELDRIHASDLDPAHAVAVEIRGRSLGTLFDRWYAVYDDVRRPFTEDLLNHLCVVGTDDGRILIKKVVRVGKTLHLLSNDHQERPITNVRIEWAARVTGIRARR